MKVQVDFVNDKVPAEREAVEAGQFPMTVHGVTITLVEKEGPNGWPVIMIEGHWETVLNLLARGGYEPGDWNVIEA